jgi:hypothetical protein
MYCQYSSSLWGQAAVSGRADFETNRSGRSDFRLRENKNALVVNCILKESSGNAGVAVCRIDRNN